MLRSVLRNFSAFGAGHVTVRVIMFFFLIYIARVLGPEQFGRYLLIATYVLFFTIASTAGIMSVAVREIVRQRSAPQSILECVLSLRLILGVTAYAALLGFTALVAPMRSMLPLAALAGTALVLDPYRDTFTAYHTAFEQMSVPSAFQVVTCVLSTSFGVALLYLGYGVLALFASAALVNLVTIVSWHTYFSKNILRYRHRFDVRQLKRLLAMVAPISPLYLGVEINSVLSITMLSFVRGLLPPAQAVGYFGPAQRISRLPLGFLGGLRRVMVPPVADALHRGQSISNEFASSLRFAVVFLSFPILVATSFFARDLLSVAYGRNYLAATVSLQILGAAAAFWISAIIAESFLIAYPEQRMSRYLPAAYVPLFVNIAVCVAFIPRYGIAGAALGALVSRGLYCWFIIYYCRAVLPLDAMRFTLFLRPLGWLVLSYAICLGASMSIDTLAVRVTAVVGTALLGMAAAGRHEAFAFWRLMVQRRKVVAKIC